LKVHRGLDHLPVFNGAVLTIGTFDGVHHGHRTIIKQVIEKAKNTEGESILMTFDPHPRQVVFPNDDSLRLLTTLDEKIKLLSDTGLDHLVVVPFNIAFSQISSTEYVEKIIIDKIGAAHVVIGYDHKFGLNRGGNFDFLKEYAQAGHFELTEIPEQQIADLRVSSTKIRTNLISGNISEANQQLSNPYILSGIITKGLKLAGALGYPTANIDIQSQDKLIPRLGTYAAECLLNDQVYNGMVYIGEGKTLQSEHRLSVEMNIFHQFDYQFYEDELEIRLLYFVRPDQTFDSKEQLIFNIDQDKLDCLNFFEERDYSNQSSCCIAILNYNGAHHLANYLPSLLQSSEDFDLVVIDNASTDESVSFLKKKYPEVQLIELDENHGFAGGYNEGLRNIAHKYVALVNSDIRGTDGWLDTLIQVLDNELDVCAVQPKILADKTPDHFEYAGASGGYIDRYGFPFCRGRVFDNVEKDEGQYDSTEEVFWTSGAAMVMRTSVFKKLGGLDASYFAHMEEIDLCWRMKKLGYKLKVVPKSTVYHLGGGTLNYGSQKKTFLNFRNNWKMLMTNTSKGRIWKIIFTRSLLDVAYFFKSLLSGKPKHALAIVKAHIAVVKQVKELRSKRQILSYQTQRSQAVENLTGMADVLLPWQYFIKKKKIYSQITHKS
jgi:riboflavin kinase/FMN adenylyltransferase